MTLTTDTEETAAESDSLWDNLVILFMLKAVIFVFTVVCIV